MIAAAVLGALGGVAAAAGGTVLYRRYRNKKADTIWNHITLGMHSWVECY